MNVLNDIVDKIFVITIAPPNERFDYITQYLDSFNIIYDLRVAPNHSFFKKNENPHLTPQEQSLESIYISLFYESIYKNYEKIIIFEDDHCFSDDFFFEFENVWNHVPADWDIIHLSETNPSTKINKINDTIARIYQKYTSNFIIYKNSTFGKIAEEMISSRMPVDCVFNEFIKNGILNGYTTNKQMSKQLSWRFGQKEKKFKSLIQPF